MTSWHNLGVANPDPVLSNESDRDCPRATRHVAQWPSLRLETLVAAPGGCSEHAHPGLTILFTKAGAFHQASEMALGRTRRTFVRSGTAYALMPGQRHHAQWAEALTTLSLYVNDAFAAAVLEDEPPRAPVDGVIGATDAVRVCFEALSRAAPKAPSSRIVAESATALLLEAIFQGERARVQSTERPPRPLEPAMVQRVAEYVDASMGESISLAELAHIAGQSTAHFARTFRAATGRSPAAFVRDRRLERAQAILRAGAPAGSRVLLGDLALELGFASQAHFTNVFRRHIGMTPGDYRRAIAGT